jgi:serine/threonine protein kinase
MMKDEYRKKRVQQEIYIHKKMHHSHIAQVLQVFENNQYLFLVMEYVNGGDLLNLVKSRGKLPESEAKSIFKQRSVAISYTHCRSVAHRDIKLDNFLLTQDGKVKLCDFGVSRIVRKGDFVTD